MTTEQDPARLAMALIVDAYEAALSQGVPPDDIAAAALSSALGLMIQIHGEDVVARIAEDLPAEIRAGDFTHRS